MILQNKTKEYNPNWPQIPDHPYIIIITGGSECGETNSLFNLINQLLDIDKIYSYEAKQQFLIDKQENTGLKHFVILKLFLNTRMILMIFMKILKNTSR